MKLYFNTTKVLFKLTIDNSFVTSLVAFQYYKSTLQTRRPGRRDGRRRSISILQKYSSNPCLAWARISSQFISILQKYSSNLIAGRYIFIITQEFQYYKSTLQT